ncbi:uncharacterized protein E5676_scaffold73G00470 [Cucumis melo var. makuwa]|uniref:Uncharacterized protein n=1 Tax=Cucumis melo var. makuwa TaxID=1194695 RepID=A0A5D3CID6_CUCMM|nr:uncharacterized protein E5676_scaffold73G00470 [Cucumis melo var. makuwa]
MYHLFCVTDSERRDPTPTSTIEILESTWRDEQCDDASIKVTSSNPLPPPPFPSCLKKKGNDKPFYKLLEVLKQIHINILFIDALEQMAKKGRINDCEAGALTLETSDILKNGAPKKMTDRRSFTVPCSINNMDLGHVLCDLGASINLMPLSIFKKLEIEEVQPMHMRLQFVDRSIAKHGGKIEDILVKVDKFLFHADFIILDYEANQEVPIIFGQPFLSTDHALIDVH